MNENKKLVDHIVEGIQNKKGHHIVIADLSAIEKTPCQYFVISEGRSPAQVEAIVESVAEFTRHNLGEKPIAVQGLENAQWVVMDYATVMVHVFLPEERNFYDLEHLWEDAELTVVPEED